VEFAQQTGLARTIGLDSAAFERGDCIHIGFVPTDREVWDACWFFVLIASFSESMRE
jgi:hypothetical protein